AVARLKAVDSMLSRVMDETATPSIGTAAAPATRRDLQALLRRCEVDAVVLVAAVIDRADVVRARKRARRKARKALKRVLRRPSRIGSTRCSPCRQPTAAGWRSGRCLLFLQRGGDSMAAAEDGADRLRRCPERSALPRVYTTAYIEDMEPISRINARTQARYRLRNMLHTFVLSAGSVALLALCAWTLAGPEGVFWA